MSFSLSSSSILSLLRLVNSAHTINTEIWPNCRQPATSRFLRNSPFPSYTTVPANNNLWTRLGARKYTKCRKTGHQASTSGCCSRELFKQTEFGNGLFPRDDH